MNRTVKRVHGVIAFALLGLLLAGCGSAGSRSEPAIEGPMQLPLTEMSTEMGADMSLEVFEDSVVPHEAALVHTGSLTLESEDPAATADEVVEVVHESGGRVESRTTHQSSDSPRPFSVSAWLVLRIPEPELEATIQRLHETADVVTESHSALDVSTQRVDLTARVSSLGTSIERLEALLEEADSVADLVEIEQALSERQAEYDSLSAQLELLEQQISYATLHVDVVLSGTVPTDAPQSFWEALIAGIASLGAALSATVIGLGYALPWLVVIGVVVAIVVTIIVVRRRKRVKRGSPGQSPQV